VNSEGIVMVMDMDAAIKAAGQYTAEEERAISRLEQAIKDAHAAYLRAQDRHDAYVAALDARIDRRVRRARHSCLVAVPGM